MKTINGDEFTASLLLSYLTGQYGPLLAEDDGLYAEDGSLSIHPSDKGTVVRVYAANGDEAGERFLTVALHDN